MLTRLYVDNFRALVNTELVLGPRSLLMGRNGTGKSTFGEVLMLIQTLIMAQSKTDDLFGSATLTRWQQVPLQRFELNVAGPSGSYLYELTLEHRNVTGTDQPRTRVSTESLTLDGLPLFRFEDGTVHLFGDDHFAGPEYPYDPGRSALGTVAPRNDNYKLTWFTRWLHGMTVLRPNVQKIPALAERDDFLLLMSASNFAAWYHSASAGDKRRDLSLHKALGEVFPGFEAMNFEYAGPGRWVLRVDFTEAGTQLPLYFGELSDGQRALIVLYSVLHLILAQGRTVFIDEPDNFVSLDEIQPWLLSVTDLVDDGHGQIIIASHHPEIFNQWATDHGILAERDACGPIRVRRFASASNSALRPAEAAARGWIEKARGDENSTADVPQ